MAADLTMRPVFRFSVATYSNGAVSDFYPKHRRVSVRERAPSVAAVVTDSHSKRFMSPAPATACSAPDRVQECRRLILRYHFGDDRDFAPTDQTRAGSRQFVALLPRGLTPRRCLTHELSRTSVVAKGLVRPFPVGLPPPSALYSCGSSCGPLPAHYDSRGISSLGRPRTPFWPSRPDP